MKLHAKTCAFALGLTLSAALAGCSGSEQAKAPAGGTTRPEITEKPAEPTPTPMAATRKGEVKKEEPPKGT